jgi:poly-gamma-glutamate synthesis protein (capsule biosynthesis protein)
MLSAADSYGVSRQNKISLTAAGDVMATGRVSEFDHPGFDELVSVVSETDTAVGNLEVLLHDYEGYPAAHGPGTYMRAPPWVADELSWMGFDLFAAATNHSIDYSHGGMEATMRALETRDLPYAGLGEDLSAAREPAYVDTSGGRCGLVAACSTITTGSEAGKPRDGLPGRPGISPLHYDVRYRMPEAHVESLREVSEQLGLEARKRHQAELGFPVDPPDGDGFRFFTVGGETHPEVAEADRFGVERVPDEDDVSAVLRQVDEADRQADLVVASLHYHEGEGANATDETVPAFVERFARDCIDAGADAFVGHGSHVLRGIELYAGAPIFYSLGNFVAQNDLVERLPEEMYERYGLDADATPADVFDARSTADDGTPRGFGAHREYYETVLPVCEYENGKLSSIAIHPVDLQRTRSRSRRGLPVVADEKTGNEILDRLQRLSDPYRTTLHVSGRTARIAV